MRIIDSNVNIIIILTWFVGFIFTCFILIGWSSTHKAIKIMTGYKDTIIANTLSFLWACVLSSFIFPISVICFEDSSCKMVAATLSVIISIFSFVIWISYNRHDREKYIKRAVLRLSSIPDEDLNNLTYEEIAAIGRRNRIISMFNEFRDIQNQKVDDVRQTSNNS